MLSSGRTLAILMAIVVVGCGPNSGAKGTGSVQTAQDYFDAVRRCDWPHAFELLDPESQARYPASQFAKLAMAQHSELGFEPNHVHVRACEEHGDEAVAHVVLSGPGPAGRRFYKEAISLRQTPAGWRVLLPPNFGQPTRFGR
jgi:hypothetical protein